MAGQARVPTTQGSPDVHDAQWAELIGLKGIRVERPEQASGAWDEALRADRPVLIEAITDPEAVSQHEHPRCRRCGMAAGRAGIAGVLSVTSARATHAQMAAARHGER